MAIVAVVVAALGTAAASFTEQSIQDRRQEALVERVESTLDLGVIPMTAGIDPRSLGLESTSPEGLALQRALIENDVVAVTLYSPSGEVIFMNARSRAAVPPVEQSALAEALATGETIVLDPVEGPTIAAQRGTDTATLSGRTVTVMTPRPDTGGVFGVTFTEESVAGQVYAEITQSRLVIAVLSIIGFGVYSAGLLRSSRRMGVISRDNEHRATHDVLTGLPNRFSISTKLDIVTQESDIERFSVVLFDLDRFKEVNDSLGHDAGDLMLQEVAGRLRSVLTSTEMLARLGGDEFAVIATEARTRSQAVALAKRMRGALRAPFRLDGLLLDMNASFGVALYPEHGSDRRSLLKHADSAMYAAKKKGADVELYNPARDKMNTVSLSLAAKLRQAISEDGLHLRYQPIVPRDPEEGLEVEALLRWSDDQGNEIAPAAFVPIAEDLGIASELTRWVVNAAVRDCAGWIREGHDLSVAVNAFPKNIIDPEFPKMIAAVLNEHDLEAERLRIEVTERSELNDTRLASRVLHDLHQLGVKIAIDDFGSGAWSLQHVKQLSVDIIKLDRSLIVAAARDEATFAIVDSITALAHRLGYRVVAEGVEDKWAMQVAADTGADLMQGYAIARPVLAEDLPGCLARARAALVDGMATASSR